MLSDRQWAGYDAFYESTHDNEHLNACRHDGPFPMARGARGGRYSLKKRSFSLSPGLSARMKDSPTRKALTWCLRIRVTS